MTPLIVIFHNDAKKEAFLAAHEQEVKDRMPYLLTRSGLSGYRGLGAVIG